MHELYRIIQVLRELGAHFELASHREDNVMLLVVVPGERWEVEVASDGSIEIEVFKSDGTIHDESKLEELFERFKDDDES